MVVLTARRKVGRKRRNKTTGKREEMEGGRDEDRMAVKYI